jgi:hypothetical protein
MRKDAKMILILRYLNGIKSKKKVNTSRGNNKITFRTR